MIGIANYSRKQSTPIFPKNKQFLPPGTHTYLCVSGGKNCLFFGNFDMHCFLKTPVLRFALLPYSRRNMMKISVKARKKSIGKQFFDKLKSLSQYNMIRHFISFVNQKK